LRYPTRREVCPWRSAPSSALLCGGHTMLTSTGNFPTRRTPNSPIRARDTSLDGTTNGSARGNSAPDVDAGVNAAPHLGGQRCRDHEGDNTNYRKLAEHNSSLLWAQDSIGPGVSGQGRQRRYFSPTDATNAWQLTAPRLAPSGHYPMPTNI